MRGDVRLGVRPRGASTHCGLMSFFDRVFYYPDAKRRGTPADHSLAYEDVWFRAADGVRLHGWFLPSATAGPARGTVLHLHGNAGNITGHYEFVHWLPSAGYHVLTFDYRGYGRSEGRTTRAGTVRDASAALDYLRSRADVDNARIVLFGQSIGGAVCVVTAAARREHVRAVAVDSAFSGYRAISRHHVLGNPLLAVLAWWVPFCIPRSEEPIDAVGRIAPVPLLFLHGTSDRIVPWRMSQELYDAAAAPKELWLIEGMDHTEVWEAEAESARRRLLGFYEGALGGG